MNNERSTHWICAYVMPMGKSIPGYICLTQELGRLTCGPKIITVFISRNPTPWACTEHFYLARSIILGPLLKIETDACMHYTKTWTAPRNTLGHNPEDNVVLMQRCSTSLGEQRVDLAPAKLGLTGRASGWASPGKGQDLGCGLTPIVDTRKPLGR